MQKKVTNAALFSLFILPSPCLQSAPSQVPHDNAPSTAVQDTAIMTSIIHILAIVVDTREAVDLLSTMTIIL